MTRGSNAHVVILFPGALGDFVLAAPALATLRMRHAGAHVTLAVRGDLRALAGTSGLVDTAASLDDADAVGLFGGSRLPAWFGTRPRLYAWIGTRDGAVADRLRALSDEADVLAVVRGDGGAEHAAVTYARQVGVHGDPAPFRWPSVPPSPRVEALWRAEAGRVLVVHAGAGSPTKRWAPEGFGAVAQRWREAGGGVIELVGPADRTLPPIGVARRLVDWSLPEVAAVLARADAYAGNDSGVTHLAGAVGVRGIAVFGPTSARRWAPRGDAIVPLEVRGWSRDGIGTRALAVTEAWDALVRRGCLDKVPGRE